MEVSIVFISMFIVIFGIFYLHYTTRHKERIALIEKDKDVSLFYSKSPTRASSHVWRIVILNLSLISMGIGLGVLIGSMLNIYMGMEEEVAFPASIFLLSGVGLLVGFFVTKKEEKD